MRAYAFPHKQQGAVLLIGMVLLVILMLGATSLMNGTILDERLAGNGKASAEAFYAAEAGYLNALEHLEPKDADNPAEYDIEKVNKHWDALYTQVEDFETPAAWNNRNKNQEPELPAALKAAGGKHAFTLSIAPVFKKEKDANGNDIMVRVPNRIQFVSNGVAAGAERTIGFDLEGGGSSGGIPPAPAAISCFGGACIVEAGAANSAPISGQNHDHPAENCRGSACWISPDDPSKAVVPAIYLSDFGNSDVELQGGGKGKKKQAFIGLSRFNAGDENNTAVASGKDKSSGAVWGSHHYPDDSDGNSTAPQNSDYAGQNAALMQDIFDATANANSTLGTINTPKASKLNPSKDSFIMNGSTVGGVLVVEGTGADGTPGTLSHHGTGAYVGLIVIRNCNQVNFGGNFSVFGAIIVDATDCPDTYKPFFGNGTPDVKYSENALNDIAGSAVGAGFNGYTRDWYEVVGN